MTTSDYLEQLTQDRDDLVDNLTEKGITGLTGDETFTELVPEVLNIPSGGGSSDYFYEETNSFNGTSSNSRIGNWAFVIKKIICPSTSVTTCQNLFSNFRGTIIDLSNLHLYNVTNMNNMFNNTYFLTNIIGIENLDVSNTTDMSFMFNAMGVNASETMELNLSNWNIKNGINTSNMFINCNNLVKIDMRSFDFTNITTYTDMFGSTAMNGVPDDCLIIVADQTQKNWINTNFSRLTNVQTVAEL